MSDGDVRFNILHSYWIFRLAISIIVTPLVQRGIRVGNLADDSTFMTYARLYNTWLLDAWPWPLYVLPRPAVPKRFVCSFCEYQVFSLSHQNTKDHDAALSAQSFLAKQA